MPLEGHLKAFWRPYYGTEVNREEIWDKTRYIWLRTGKNSILSPLGGLLVLGTL